MPLRAEKIGRSSEGEGGRESRRGGVSNGFEERVRDTVGTPSGEERGKWIADGAGMDMVEVASQATAEELLIFCCLFF